jgi:hypothetical protein
MVLPGSRTRHQYYIRRRGLQYRFHPGVDGVRPEKAILATPSSSPTPTAKAEPFNNDEWKALNSYDGVV